MHWRFLTSESVPSSCHPSWFRVKGSGFSVCRRGPGTVALADAALSALSAATAIAVKLPALCKVVVHEQVMASSDVAKFIPAEAKMFAYVDRRGPPPEHLTCNALAGNACMTLALWRLLDMRGRGWRLTRLVGTD